MSERQVFSEAPDWTVGDGFTVAHRAWCWGPLPDDFQKSGPECFETAGWTVAL